jgi:integrase/recombinase XerD
MGVKRRITKNTKAELITIAEAFDEFITEKEAKNLSPATLRSYNQSYGYFMDFCGFTDESTTDEIQQSFFFKWMNSMRIDGVQHTSINHYLRDLRCFMYWCMDRDRAYIEPAFKIEMIKGQEEQLKFFSDEDVELLLEKPKRNELFSTWRTWAIVNWVLGTSNRSSTICNVKIGDIDFKRKEIVLAHTKNKKAQSIPLSSSLEVVIKEYIRMWREGCGTDAWLFPNIGDEQLTTNALRHSFRKYCLSRGVEQTNIHGLRHNFARGWIKNNGNQFALQQVMGHASTEMTRKYVKLFAEDIKEDFDKFSPLDTIKKNTKRTKTVKRSF